VKSSRKSLFAVIGLIAGSICVLGPLVRYARGLYLPACALQVPCCPDPPPGMFCNIEAPDDGSQPQSGGVPTTMDSCGYIYSTGNPGWPCGGAIPDSTATNCQ
jgi:hypothetical protein